MVPLLYRHRLRHLLVAGRRRGSTQRVGAPLRTLPRQCCVPRKQDRTISGTFPSYTFTTLLVHYGSLAYQAI